MWRYGVLYRSCMLVEHLRAQPAPRTEIISSFADETFHNVRIEDVLTVSHNAGWITATNDDVLVATDEGIALIESGSPQLRMRVQVECLINLMNPDWAAMAVQGRQALLRYTDPNVRQCFKEAGLADGYDADIVEWWDRLAGRYRSVKDYKYTEIGRQGERLSCDHEYSRTGIQPNWIALEDSEAGYDMVSQISADDDTRLLIEVKTTTQSWDSAVFYISRHEWDILSQADHAVIHLWCVQDVPAQHATITLTDLEGHVPADCGAGEWKKFCCPFREFTPSPAEVQCGAV